MNTHLGLNPPTWNRSLLETGESTEADVKVSFSDVHCQQLYNEDELCIVQSHVALRDYSIVCGSSSEGYKSVIFYGSETSI